MRSIEVKTSHNIILIFELASLMQRILATVIDLIILSISISLLSVITSNNEVAIYILVIPIILFYNLTFELFNNGQTLGKMMLKIRVISLDGKSISLRNTILRWAFRLIDITASSGIAAILWIFSSEKSQRLGDVLANTIVISLANTNNNSLKKLSHLEHLNYKVSYPSVIMYNEKDMLLLKDALQRLKKHNNIETNQFCNDLSTRIKNDLKLPKQEIGTKKFLNTILNDYIMLTR